MPAGRPTSFTKEIIDQSESYLMLQTDKTIDDTYHVHLPTIEGLANYLNISRSTLYLWQKEHPEFSDIIESLQQKQALALINNGLAGNYNPTIAKVLLTKHGYTDKQEIDQKTEHSGSIQHTIDHSKLSDAALREIATLDKPTEGTN